MNAQEDSRFRITAEDIRQYPWQDLIAGDQHRECWQYCRIFNRASNEHKSDEKDLGERVYGFLGTIASFSPAYDSPTEPYMPMWRNIDGNRSLNPDDLADADLQALKVLLDEIQDPEFKARVADVLWIRCKDFKAAQTAIIAFIKAAENLKCAESWPPFVERLDRAAELASIKGFETQRADLLKFVEATICEFEHNPQAGLLCCRLMGILRRMGEGDHQRYAGLAERLANEFAAASNWHFSEAYWQLAEGWHRRAKDDAAAQRCAVAAAECCISRAEDGLADGPGKLSYAAHWMGKGLEGLRRAGADRERIRKIHLKFLALQKMALTELSPFEFDVDAIPGLKENRKAVQENAIANVTGHDFHKTVLRFALIHQPTSLEELKRRVVETGEDIIWDKLFGANRLDIDGKVADKMEPLAFDEDPNQVALRKKLVQSAHEIEWPVAVEWKIEPARQAIHENHPVRYRDLSFLVVNNPFIPQGHEGIYLRGIHAGFYGDWLAAMHLLIPQLEASVRFVLQQHGEITSTLESDGTQKERDINQLLWSPAAERIFGAEILFDLRGILIERFGANMRNESAHGLMPEGAFYCAEAVYLWWLTIHLCWIGYRAAMPPELPEESL